MLLLAVVAELIGLVQVPQTVGSRRPAVLRCANLVSALAVQVLLVRQANLGAVRSWSLTA